MKKSLTSEEALSKLGLLEKVSKECGDRKDIEIEQALAALLLRGEIHGEQWGQYMDLTRNQKDIDLMRIMGEYHMPKRKDMGMTRLEYLKYFLGYSFG